MASKIYNSFSVASLKNSYKQALVQYFLDVLISLSSTVVVVFVFMQFSVSLTAKAAAATTEPPNCFEDTLYYKDSRMENCTKYIYQGTFLPQQQSEMLIWLDYASLPSRFFLAWLVLVTFLEMYVLRLLFGENTSVRFLLLSNKDPYSLD